MTHAQCAAPQPVALSGYDGYPATASICYSVTEPCATCSRSIVLQWAAVTTTFVISGLSCAVSIALLIDAKTHEHTNTTVCSDSRAAPQMHKSPRLTRSGFAWSLQNSGYQ